MNRLMVLTTHALVHGGRHRKGMASIIRSHLLSLPATHDQGSLFPTVARFAHYNTSSSLSVPLSVTWHSNQSALQQCFIIGTKSWTSNSRRHSLSGMMNTVVWLLRSGFDGSLSCNQMNNAERRNLKYNFFTWFIAYVYNA